MTEYEPFSLRQRTLTRQGQQIPYKYDTLPSAFLVQAATILARTIGETRPGASTYSGGSDSYFPERVWDEIHDEVAYTAGLPFLSKEAAFWAGAPFFAPRNHDAKLSFAHYLGSDSASVEQKLDAIEIAFRMIFELERHMARYDRAYRRALTATDAVQELNRRFLQHDIGYAFKGGYIVRIDSEFVHVEVVEPALRLLNQAGFGGAEPEFLTAHEHYRHGRNEEALVEALKAFESTMKQICDARGWSYAPTATAKELIRVLIDQGLFPNYLDQQLTQLRVLLESGIPTIRNKEAGHGRGSTQRQVPAHLVAYGLHLTAANIVLLVETYVESQRP